MLSKSTTSDNYSGTMKRLIVVCCAVFGVALLVHISNSKVVDGNEPVKRRVEVQRNNNELIRPNPTLFSPDVFNDIIKSAPSLEEIHFDSEEECNLMEIESTNPQTNEKFLHAFPIDYCMLVSTGSLIYRCTGDGKAVEVYNYQTRDCSGQTALPILLDPQSVPWLRRVKCGGQNCHIGIKTFLPGATSGVCEPSNLQSNQGWVSGQCYQDGNSGSFKMKCCPHRQELSRATYTSKDCTGPDQVHFSPLGCHGHGQLLSQISCSA